MRKPEYLEKTPDDELQEKLYTKATELLPLTETRTSTAVLVANRCGDQAPTDVVIRHQQMW